MLRRPLMSSCCSSVVAGCACSLPVCRGMLVLAAPNCKCTCNSFMQTLKTSGKALVAVRASNTLTPAAPSRGLKLTISSATSGDPCWLHQCMFQLCRVPCRLCVQLTSDALAGHLQRSHGQGFGRPDCLLPGRAGRAQGGGGHQPRHLDARGALVPVKLEPIQSCMPAQHQCCNLNATCALPYAG